MFFFRTGNAVFTLLVATSVVGCGDDSKTTGATTSGGGGTGGLGGGGMGATGGTGALPNGGGGTGGEPECVPGTDNEPLACDGNAPDCSAPTGPVPALQLTQIASGLDKPVLIKSAPCDDERLFIVEQSGRIRILKDGAVDACPFLDISESIKAGGEQGLLGLAFAPDYATSGRFFVHHSAPGTGDTIIAEFERQTHDYANPVPINAQVLTVAQPFGNHNGGSIEFGADGYLYIALGDGGSGGDPLDSGQSLDSLLGKILRIDVSTSPYSIPAGNLTGAGVAPEIWDYGVRNPWRISFDACTGDMYIGDVGQGAIEEVDVAAAGAGNNNWGWRLKEGTACFNPQVDCDPGGITAEPAAEYTHAGGSCSISGGYVYRGANIPELRGTYFYGDYCSGKVWTFDWNAGVTQNLTERTDDLGTSGLNISAWGQDNAGEIYLVNLAGSIYRIDAE